MTEMIAILENAPAPVSAKEPDWSREHGNGWNPGRKLLTAIRGYQRWQNRAGPWARIICSVHVLRHRFWSAVAGADIPLTTKISGGLLLPHPNGIVIHPNVSIGPNCLIFQQVTLGTDGKKRKVPCIGGHVDIGAGAKILGGVTIGDHAKIGANAVVLCDVPPGASAIGIPAKIIQKNENK